MILLTASAYGSSSTAAVASPSPRSILVEPARSGMSPDDATFAWDMSPECWDPEDPATALRIQTNLDDIKQECFRRPKSVSEFVTTVPSPSTDATGKPGVAPSSRYEPLTETNPIVLIEKMKRVRIDSRDRNHFGGD